MKSLIIHEANKLKKLPDTSDNYSMMKWNSPSAVLIVLIVILFSGSLGLFWKDSSRRKLEGDLQHQFEQAMNSSDRWKQFSYQDKIYSIAKHQPTKKWHFFVKGNVVGELVFEIYRERFGCFILNTRCYCRQKKDKK